MKSLQDLLIGNWQIEDKELIKLKKEGEIIGSTAKIYKQKGMGRARHGSKKVVQFKGGGVVHGPTPRSHLINLIQNLKKTLLELYFLLS